MTAVSSIIVAAAILSLLMAAAWFVQRRTGQSGWADVFWSFAVGIGGIIVTAVPHVATSPIRVGMVTLMVACWSLRLGFHILSRTASAAAEDPRYADLRRSWGDRFQMRIFLFLQIQALCGLGLVVTVFVAAHRPGAAPSFADIAGVALLIAAVAGEGIADYQLRRFSADPANRGRVCDVGLWGWSRHPNYFFEWLAWLAYPIIAVDLSGGWWQGWLAFIGPAMMYWLLVYASGIPPLEAHMLKSRGDAFRAYVRRTSAFFPLPPRKD